MKELITALILFFLFSANAHCQPHTKLTAAEIFRRAAENYFNASENLRRNYVHRETEVTETFSDGIVKKREEVAVLVFCQNGVQFTKILSLDKVPLHNARAEKKKNYLVLDKKFFERFDYFLIEPLGSEKNKHWLVRARPKPNLPPPAEKKDRLLNNLAIDIWIDRNFNLLRLEAELISPVEYAWPGFMGGKALSLKVTIELAMADCLTSIRKVRLEYAYAIKIMFWPIYNHSLKTIVYTDYERSIPK